MWAVGSLRDCAGGPRTGAVAARAEGSSAQEESGGSGRAGGGRHWGTAPSGVCILTSMPAPCLFLVFQDVGHL